LGLFHRVIDKLGVELDANRPADLLKLVMDSLNAVASSPGNNDIANNYRTALNSFRDTANRLGTTFTLPSERTVIKSIGADKFLAPALINSVLSTIQEHNVAPSLAASALLKLHASITDFHAGINSVRTSFKFFSVEYDDLQPGDTEITIVLPRGGDAENFPELLGNLSQWDTSLKIFKEVYGEDNAPLTIKRISSTDWQIVLVAIPPVLLGIAACVSGLNEILDKLIETRRLIEKLLRAGAKEAAVKPIQEETDTRLDIEVRALAEKVIDDNSQEQDAGRRAETKNHMNISLKFIARQITKGAVVELRYKAPSEPTEKAPDESHEQFQERVKQAKSLEAISQKIASFNETTAKQLQDAEGLALLQERPRTDRPAP